MSSIINQSPNQIASLLVQHGIKDITNELDLGRCSSKPFAYGGFGSIYRGELRDGTSVVIKRVGMRENLELRGGHYLAGTVEYLHDKGIVHGDIKGDNILVSDSGDLQLVDFGNATLVNYLTLCFTRTSPELGCSISGYKAPEILLEISETHTTESDIFSLGMTILQILTRELPYARKPDPVAIAKIVGGILPPRPMVDDILQNRHGKDYLWDLLLRCWERNPNHRPTATEVKQTLIAIRRGSNISSDDLGFRFRITSGRNWLQLVTAFPVNHS
ncbi:kinase-like domain-containing protein [Rhizoctonia solani]|nr:kinase-like domain-containing protein [Rhizoctonia solani]